MSDNATFGAGEAAQTSLINTGAGSATGDIFIAKFSSSGNLIWAKLAGGTTNDKGTGIDTTVSGVPYVTGSFTGSAVFGPGEVGETTYTSSGGRDIFVAKFYP